MNEPIYTAMIPIQPKTKKNSQKIIINSRTRRPQVVQGDDFRQYEHDCGFFLKRPAEPFDFPINIKYTFYRKNAQRCDLSNLIAAADDILVKYKIIKDDSFTIVTGHDGSRVHIDKNNPRTEIIITRTLTEETGGPEQKTKST
jgi:Holliday junction resolvase RusA-like endonuclease